ncbi:hypothetical protein A4G20_03375 [Pasteurellaceae bacterium RH1A]|nr:hypothetical protein A4G20_03375 [Pasteurellaceae bacterium RH1A]
MKKKLLTLLLSLSCVPSALADDAFFSLELSKGGSPIFLQQGQQASGLKMIALQGFKLSNIAINSGQCPLAFGYSAQSTFSQYSDFLAEFRKNSLTIKPKQEVSFYFGCGLDETDEITITTDKGIQQVTFDSNNKPISTIKPLSEKATAFEKKAETKPLNELYRVSNYTCYQDKDQAGEVAEYCTPLMITDRADFDLPLGRFMSKPLFAMRAQEKARWARYIEHAETIPSELPKFKAKKLPEVSEPPFSGTITAQPHPENSLRLAERGLNSAISFYESSLLEFIRIKIKVAEMENELEKAQQELAKVKKALKSNSSERLQRRAQTLEESIYGFFGYLAKLEIYATELTNKEKSFSEYKQRIEKAQQEVIYKRQVWKESEKSAETNQ